MIRIQLAKFLSVGAVNFCLTFVIFFTLLNYFDAHYFIALSIAWFIGIIFSYVANYVWVFKPDLGINFGKRFIKFISSYLVSFFLNMALLWYFVERHFYDPFLVQVGLVPVIICFNFVSSKYWSLKRVKST